LILFEKSILIFIRTITCLETECLVVNEYFLVFGSSLRIKSAHIPTARHLSRRQAVQHRRVFIFTPHNLPNKQERIFYKKDTINNDIE
jgi:hypothetical protein